MNQFGLYVQLLSIAQYGDVTERLKEPAWNAGAGKPVEGSNPSVTAILNGYIVGEVQDNDGRLR